MEAGDFSILDEKGLGHPLDAIGPGDSVAWVEAIGVSDVELVEEGPRFPLRILVGDADKRHALASVFLPHPLQDRGLLPAGLTPTAPEIDYDHPVMKTTQEQLTAVEESQIEIRSWALAQGATLRP